jgi:histone H1/5
MDMEREELEKVKGALDDFRQKLFDVVKKGKGEADRVAKVAQVKLELGSLKRQRKDLFGELGESFYKSYKKPGKKDEAAIADIVAHIAEIEKRSVALNRQLKAEGKEPKAAPKKRGRLSKSGAAKKAGSTAAPKGRGRPPKAAAVKKTATSSAPKRRGRPPKAASTS